MNRELLKQAQQGLRLADIGLRQTKCTIADRFDPRHEPVDAEVQMKFQLSRSEILEIDDGKEVLRKLFRVYVEVGVRWVQKPSQTASQVPSGRSESDPESGQQLATIEATFIAEYEMQSDLDTAALNEFALHNAIWNIWPFWREYCASQALRMNLPKVMLPLHPSIPLPARTKSAPNLTSD
ncbi:MAG: hypothetical protein M0Q42_03685 [Xanthomonadales bacterium]|nr:hypothetical protein [Xanthomonadales bacterium]